MRDKYGKTALGEAVGSSKIEILDLFIKAGANINEQNEHGDTYLTSLATYPSREVELQKIKTLIDAGANINVQNQKGETVLHKAITAMLFQKENAKKIVMMILEKKCNLDLKNKEGKTPLMEVIEKEYIDLAKLLLKKGANLNIENASKETIIFSVLNNMELLKLIVENGADLNVYNRIFGNTPLMQSIYNEYNETVKYLIEKVQM